MKITHMNGQSEVIIYRKVKIIIGWEYIFISFEKNYLLFDTTFLSVLKWNNANNDNIIRW